jgi:uncharacterized protein DUF3376
MLRACAKLRRELNAARQGLLDIDRAALNDDELREALAASVDGILPGQRADPGTLDRATDLLRSHVAGRAADAHRKVTEILTPHSGESAEMARVRDFLRRNYVGFESYDVILFPISFGTAIGEASPVEVWRISPEDARRLRDRLGSGTSGALAGATFNHFGAFLDRRWRRHDLAWGRLDAAERLITILIREDNVERERLIDEAHDAILREEFARGDDEAEDSTQHAPPNASAEERRQWFAEQYRLPEAPASESELFGRGTQAAGRVLAGALEGTGSLSSRGVRWLGKAAVAAWGLVFDRRKRLALAAAGLLVGMNLFLIGLVRDSGAWKLAGIEVAVLAVLTALLFGRAEKWIAKDLRRRVRLREAEPADQQPSATDPGGET